MKQFASNKQALKRLKSVILADKTAHDTNFLGVLKSDLAVLLGNYLDLKSAPQAVLEVDERGTYVLSITAEAERVKTLSILK